MERNCVPLRIPQRGIISIVPFFIFYSNPRTKKQPDFFVFPAVLDKPYSFFGLHTAVTSLLQFGHFVFISTSFGESVPISIRRPPHLGHFSCSIGYSSFSETIFHPPLAAHIRREPDGLRLPFLLLKGRLAVKILESCRPRFRMPAEYTGTAYCPLSPSFPFLTTRNTPIPMMITNAPTTISHHGLHACPV